MIFPGASAWTPGSSTATSRPPAGWLRALTVPWWAVATDRTMDRPVPGALVRRTAAVPAVDSGGISVLATQTSLLHTLGGQVARGVFLNAATIHYPAGGLALAIAVGVAAGVYPAARAARLPPAEALRTMA